MAHTWSLFRSVDELVARGDSAVREGAELNAFDFTAARLRFPSDGWWKQSTAPAPRRAAALGPRPRLRPALAALVGTGDAPYRRLLSPKRIPRLHETDARGARRAGEVRSFLAARANYTGRTARAGRAGETRYRVLIDGYIEITHNGHHHKFTPGTQTGDWQTFAAIPDHATLHAAYFRVARDAVQVATSALYPSRQKLSAEALLYPLDIRLQVARL